jgi:IMP dehydrogenase
MDHCGSQTVDEFRTKAKFLRVSSASLVESHPHDISITHEAPNYFGVASRGQDE